MKTIGWTIFNSGRRGYVLTNTTSNFINNIRHVRSLRMSHIYSLFTSNGGCYWGQDLGLPKDISLFHPQLFVQKNMFFFLTGGQLIGRSVSISLWGILLTHIWTCPIPGQCCLFVTRCSRFVRGVDLVTCRWFQKFVLWVVSYFRCLISFTQLYLQI